MSRARFVERMICDGDGQIDDATGGRADEGRLDVVLGSCRARKALARLGHGEGKPTIDFLRDHDVRFLYAR